MEIREVPAKASSQRSHSSSSRGSIKGALGTRKIKIPGSEEQKAPEQPARASPERPPRPFLKTSFGQRLSAQCGSIFDTSCSHQAGCSRATSVPSTAGNPHGQTLEGGAAAVGGAAAGAGSSLGTGGGDRTKLRSIGNSHSASGRGSSGLSEVDVKGMALVATAAREVPAFRPGSDAQQQQQALKLWGGAIPKQRAIAMVGQVATSSRVSADTFSFGGGVRGGDHSSSRRDGSPLGNAHRATSSGLAPVLDREKGKETKVAIKDAGLQLVPPKLECGDHEEKSKPHGLRLSSELELEEARKEMMIMASASGAAALSGRHSQASLNLPHVKAEVDDQAMILSSEAKPGRESSSLPRCSTDLLQPAPLSTAADSEAPTSSELGAAHASKARPSFKTDCGFLKLLPSKRKFSLEAEHDQASPLQKPASYVLSTSLAESDHAGLRLSSNSSLGIPIVSRKSLLVHLADKPKSVVANDVTRDHSNSKERSRTPLSDHQFASAQKPVVGSFMRWMIDVGKGLAKKRCFGSEATAAPSTELSPLGSPVGGLLCSSTGLRLESSSKAKDHDLVSPTSMKRSPDVIVEHPGRAQSPQSMDCTDDGAHKEASEMQTSGDEQQQRQQRRRREEHQLGEHEKMERRRDMEDPQPSGDGNEGGGNSANATEGTTRSCGPPEQLKDGKRSKEHASKAREQQQYQLVKQDPNPDQGQAPAAPAPAPALVEVDRPHASQQQQEPLKHEQQHDVSKSKSGGGGEEASFGMWQAASCLTPSQQQQQQQQQPEKSSKLQRSSTGSRSKARNLAAALDGSGDPEGSQGMAEFVASMATVKNWVNSSFFKQPKDRASSSSRPCSFCGLKGHSVMDCSETLECELRELERRALVLEEMSSEVLDWPCLRCLGMGHLGAQCRFSVTEAASRARENSEMRNWRFMKRNSTNTNTSNAVKASSINATVADSPSLLLLDHAKAGNAVLSTGLVPPSGNLSIAPPPEPDHKAARARDQRKNEESPKDNNTHKRAGLQKPGTPTPAKKTTVAAAPQASDTLPSVPKDMLAAIESVRLSRSELWRWMECPDFNTNVRGFFLRLRFGRWEKDLGGTGYRMARIRGAIRKPGGDDKNMSVSVDLGDMECTVDSQYVSNHSFTEAELVEWWRGRWKAGKRLINEAELQAKLAQRHKW